MDQNSHFRERITEITRRRVGDIERNPRNPKRYTEEKQKRLTAVLNQFGKAGVLLTYIDPDGVERFMDGNARRGLGDDEIWYIARTDLTQKEVDDLVILYDPLALPDWEAELAKVLVEETAVVEPELEKMLASVMDEIKASLAPEKPAASDAEPQINKAEELREKWGVEPGQLWRLPSRTPGQEHRLICGDCTDGDVVASVMGGAMADMVWTDPPYGVAVGEKNKFLNSIARSNRIEGNLKNDTLDEPALVKMLRSAFDNALAFSTAGAAWYVAAPPGPLHVLFGQALKDRGIWRQTIQWVKNNATFAPLGVDYHWQAEPIFYGWKPGGAHRYYGGRQQTTVWNIDRPLKSPEHPTMKPVELVERAVENSSQPGQIVYDGFAGGGSAVIACENLRRQARVVELDEGYCSVILQRYQDAFNITPELITDTAVPPVPIEATP